MEVVNIILTVILVIVTSIYTYITYKTLLSYKNPILFLRTLLVDSEYEWDKYLMRDLDPVQEQIRGLSKINIDKKIKFKIVNNGVNPAYDIIIKYEIHTFKNDIMFGIDEADVKDYKPVLYKTSKREKEYNYLAPKEDIDFDIVFTSNFPRIEIIVTELKSNEVTSIKKRTTIFVYKNSEHCEIGDSIDYRNMIGV
ncbi:hypothetical protein [Bizionia paragorgiae]|uniref:hypothetical protein n=1 Tax=Bizionia paragorgiae TaxID=283786 RepID=UPI003A8E9307